MKRLIASLLFTAGLASAGPLNVVTYPVRHPLKVQRVIAMSLYRAVKALVW